MKSVGFATLGSDLMPTQDVPPDPWPDPRLDDPAQRAAIEAAGREVIARHQMERRRVAVNVKNEQPISTKKHGEMSRADEVALFSYINALRTDAARVVERECGPYPVSRYAGTLKGARLDARDAWLARRASNPAVIAAQRAASVVIDLAVRWNAGLIGMAIGMVGFHGGSAEREDFWSDGLVSLHKAVEGFDPNRGLKFSTYASNAIMGNWWRRQARARLKAAAHRSINFRTDDGKEVIAEGHALAVYRAARAERRGDEQLSIGEVAVEVLDRPDLAELLGVPAEVASTLLRRLDGQILRTIAEADKCSREMVRQRECKARAALLAYCLKRLGRADEIDRELRRAGLDMLGKGAACGDLTPEQKAARGERMKASRLRRDAERIMRTRRYGAIDDKKREAS